MGRSNSPFRIRRAVVTGGAGFVGSHLCERLLADGAEVVCIDNLLTGTPDNILHLRDRKDFVFLRRDVAEPLHVPGFVDAVFHLASPASPRDYLRFPVPTLEAGSLGTFHALGLARKNGARFLLTSTSEVYGDPLVHPQPESYWGNVNPVGPRSVYDEAKRFGEAVTAAYGREGWVDVRIARIFNTMGPRMRGTDGRVIPAFVSQALKGVPFTVHGTGHQTRSICYVSDLIEGLLRLIASDCDSPVNLGNPEEHSVLEIAELVAEAVGVQAQFEYLPRPVDDPQVRRPDITKAQAILRWRPEVSLREGLQRTVAWFRDHVEVGSRA